MSVNRSKFTRYSQKTVPHRKRSLQMDMRGVDWYGKWFRCWNCGQINNADRAQVAAVYNGGDKAQVFEYDDINYGSANVSTALYPEFTTNIGQYIVLDLQSICLMKLDAQGNVITPHVADSVVITGGCRFCGCMNWH